MELLKNLIELLIEIGVVITAVRMYLITNKLWKRKHQIEVVESISVVACILYTVPVMPIVLKLAFVDGSVAAALTNFIIIFGYSIILLIGIGCWVGVNRGKSRMTLLLRALNLERKESTDLINALLHPEEAVSLLKILGQLAAVDDEISNEEIALIQRTAHHWGVEPPDLKPGRVANKVSPMTLRQSMTEYLLSSPPKEQAAELIDLLIMMMRADGNISHEEELVLEELTGMINGYLDEGLQESAMYEVVIVPQNPRQSQAVKELLPAAAPQSFADGEIFSVGTFHSHRYAEEICAKYIGLKLFTHCRKITA